MVVWGDSNSVCLYANDTNVVVSGQMQESIEVSSHIGLSMVQDFSNNKNLQINSNKSNFISFSTKQARTKLCPNILLMKKNRLQVQNNKFLDLGIDENYDGIVM